MPHDAATYESRIDATWDNPSETKVKNDNAVAAARTKYDSAEKDVRSQYAIIAVVAPYITAISPTTYSGAPASTFLLTIDGGGFTSGSKIQVGVTQYTTTLVSPTRVTATITAPGGSGSADASVVDGNQRSNVKSISFTIALTRAAPTESNLKAEIIEWLLENGVTLDEPALTNLTKAELLTLVADIVSPPE